MAGKRSRLAFEADIQRQESPFVFYGTPLPPLDERARDDGSFVPVWKQEVTDDRGRKRLHGAFTGGFSAGYYNTVGSKEGWTPSTFVSSRQNRQKNDHANQQQRPEDFMDEEDLREAEEARKLATTDGFAGFESTEQDSIRIASLMDLLRPAGESVGSKLLKRMGWKEGQGIGPKVRRKANIGDEELQSDATHLFAPDDSPMISFSRKTDFKGLGYEGESSLAAASGRIQNTTSSATASEEEDDGHSTSLFKARKTPGRGRGREKGSLGFGIGVLNDTGSDDENPYELGPKISYNKVVGGDKKSKKQNAKIKSKASPSVKTKPTCLSKKLLPVAVDGFRRSRDGRLPLSAFILGDELDAFASISLHNNSMAPPPVPEDWKSSKTPSQDIEKTTYTSTADAAKASTLNAQSRAALLGEKQLSGQSVFDFLSPAARSKLVAASGKADLPQAGSQPPPPGYEASVESKQESLHKLVPQLESQVALQALNRGVGGWMPYAEDENKRARYRSFLEIRAGLVDELPPRDANATQADWINEMNEFARAAQVFKPVTGLMASRFTSSTSAPTSHNESGDGATGDPFLKKAEPKPEDPSLAAAKMGMFGPMTRTVINFYPSRLVCKRFDVQPPENGVDTGNQSGVNASSQRQSTGSRFDTYQYENDSSSILSSRNPVEGEGSKPMQESKGAPHAETSIDSDKNEALEKERPGQEVFKAIFGSDDEEDEDD